MKNIKVSIKGMHCKSCKALIEDVLSDEKGVKKAQVSVETGSAQIQFDEKAITAEKILKLIEKQGYTAGL